jgi:hypothetical protein
MSFLIIISFIYQDGWFKFNNDIQFSSGKFVFFYNCQIYIVSRLSKFKKYLRQQLQQRKQQQR